MLPMMGTDGPARMSSSTHLRCPSPAFAGGRGRARLSQPTDTLRVQQPEAGLHPELLPPLAELILTAAKDTQVVVVTHATDLAVSSVGRPRTTGSM
jgi:hypothetical protein